MKISGCVIAKNEELNIANCINNLKRVTDEIIVVDTGSDDNTVQIAEELGAFVYMHQWENDFSKAKNSALEHATGDWIIFLDADEYFLEETLPNLRLIIQEANDNPDVDGISCQLINLDVDSGKIISNNNLIRIFRNNGQIRFVNRIHEEIRKDGNLLNGINILNRVSIIHTGYSASVKRKKAERNLELLLANPGDEKSLYYLATTYYMLTDYENAYKYSDQALASAMVTKYAYLSYKMHLIKIRVKMAEGSNRAEVHQLIEEANRSYGSHPEIAAAEADFLLEEKLYSRALEKYLYAVDCHEKLGNTLIQNDFPMMLDEIFYLIAQIYYRMNREADALSYLVSALRVNRCYGKAFGSMLALFRAIPEHEAVALINSIYDFSKEEDVRFVISQVAGCGRAKIVLYYADKWINVFGHEDDILIYAFLSQDEYRKALDIALFCLKSNKEAYAPLTASVLVMGRLYSETERCRELMGEDYFEIVSCCADGRKYSGNADAYLSVLSVLDKYSDRYDPEEYLRLGEDLGLEAIRKTAEIFLADSKYRKAASYFMRQHEAEIGNDGKAAAAFQTGYCFYKLKQYRESVEWMKRASEAGYKDNDLGEYLGWIMDQSPATATEVGR